MTLLQAAAFDIPSLRSKPTHEKQYDDDDQDDADDTDTAVTEAEAVAAETATEATEQEDDEEDDEYYISPIDMIYLPLQHLTEY